MIPFQYNQNKTASDDALQNAFSNPVNSLNERFHELVSNPSDYETALAAMDNDEKRLFKAFGAKVMGMELDIPVEIPNMGDPFSTWMDRGIAKLREAEQEQDEEHKVELQTEAQYMMYGALFLLSEKKGFDVRKEINEEMPELGGQEQEKQQEAPPKPQGEAPNENEEKTYAGMPAEEADRQRRYDEMLAQFERLQGGATLPGGEHLREDNELVDKNETPITPETLDMTPDERRAAYERTEREREEKRRSRRQNGANATINRELAEKYRAQQQKGTFLKNYGEKGAEFNETAISQEEMDAIIEKMKVYDPIQRMLRKTPMFNLFSKDLLKKEPKRNAGDYKDIVDGLCDAYDTGFYAHKAIEEEVEDFQPGMIDPSMSETGEPEALKTYVDKVITQRDQLRRIVAALEADGTGTNALGFKRWKNSTEYTAALDKLKELTKQYEAAAETDPVDSDKLPNITQRAHMFKVVKAYLDDKKSVRVTTSGQLRVQCFLDALNILSPSTSLDKYYKEINRARNALQGAEHEAGSVTHYASGAEADLDLALRNIAREEGAEAVPERNTAPVGGIQYHADYVDTNVSRMTGATVGAAIKEGCKLLLSRHHPPQHPIDLSTPDNTLALKRLYMLSKLAHISPQGLYTKVDAAVCSREMAMMTAQKNDVLERFGAMINAAPLDTNGETYTNNFMNELASTQDIGGVCIKWLSRDKVEDAICRRQAKILWDENFKKLRAGDPNALDKLNRHLTGPIKEQYDIIKREYEDAPGLAEAGIHPEKTGDVYVRFKNWLNDFVNDPMTQTGDVDYTAEPSAQREADSPAAG